MPFEARLTRIRELSPTTRDFRFLRTDDEIVKFTPGQLFRFTFTDEQGEFERSYSLCNFGSNVVDSAEMDLVISIVEGGRASQLLFDCEVGLNVIVNGPFGRLVVPEKLPERLFLVATSVGIAPFLPMLTQLSDNILKGETEVYFIYGTRNEAEFVYGDLLKEYSATHQGFHLSVCYSRETDKVLDSYEHKGYVQDRLRQFSVSPESDYIMLCGNPDMIDQTYRWLKEEGFGVRQVVREKYVFAKAETASKKPVLTDQQRKLIAEKMKKFSGE